MRTLDWTPPRAESARPLKARAPGPPPDDDAGNPPRLHGPSQFNSRFKEKPMSHHDQNLQGAAAPRWRPLALLPLGLGLGGMAAAEEAAVTLPAVEVQGRAEEASAARDWGYHAANSSAGTKTDTPLLETPQSVSVVTRRQMEAQNARSLSETLRYTPGVQSEPFGFEPRMTYLKMRGFDATTSGLYQDGLKIANPGYFVGYSLEPYGAERVEVPRGPVSVLYGQAGPGGLVNYVSKRPLFASFGEVAFQAGNYGRLQGQFDFGGTLDKQKTVAYRVAALMRGSDTQVDFVPDDRFYVAPSLTWRPGEDTSFTFLSHYQKDTTRSSQRLPAEGTLYPNPYGKITTRRFTGEPEVDRYGREEYAVGYALEHRLNDWVKLRQNLRYYDNHTDDSTLYPTALLADLRTVSRALYSSFGKLQGFNLDSQAQFDFSTGFLAHTLLAGVDYQQVDASTVQSYGAAPDLDIYRPAYGAAVDPAAVFRDEKAAQYQTGLYLQDQIKLAEKWRITLGGRYDMAENETRDRLDGGARSTQKDDKTTGRAGLVYLADNGLAPYFSYATSFLPVLGADPAGKPFKPETAEQYEFGVKFQPKNQNSFITLAYFDLTRNHFTTTNPATFELVQRGEAHANGVELEGVAGFDNGLNLTGSYSYLNADVTKSAVPEEVGEPLEYVPEHKATLWADYTVPAGIAKGFGLGLGTRYIGPSHGNSYAAENTLKIPSYVLFDAAVHYTWKQFSFAVNLQNMLDKEYVATAFTSGGEFATYGARRVVAGTVKFSF